MQKRLHDFMDKIQSKSLAERRKLLFQWSILIGVVIFVLGLWTISNDILAVNAKSSNLDDVGAVVKAPSAMDTLSSSFSSLVQNVKSSLQDLNDKLGELNK